MFGIIRPCRHRLSEELFTDWVAHLCGLCLTLRAEHGQLARVATNYDGLVISGLVEAQQSGADRQPAGRCPLRGMRRASVARGEGAQLAAAVSLVLASAKLEDHAADGDGAFRRPALAGFGRKVADRWTQNGASSGLGIGFDTAVLTAAIDRQHWVETAVTSTDDVLAVTEPTERATSAAFEHTAVLAGLPQNRPPLAEAGRLFGRTAHLLDAVEDLAKDTETGAFNPLAATATSLEEARRLCDDAVLGVALALQECTFHQGELVHALLVHELEHAVRRTFGHAQYPGGRPPGPHPGGPGMPPPPPPCGPYGAPPPPPPYSGYGPPPPPPPPPAGNKGHKQPNDGDGGGCWYPKFRVPPVKRNPFLGCLVASYMCCTCQFCCRDPYPGPCSGKPHRADGCSACDHNCCDCCDCCN